jgi:hypothetical protein
MAVTPLATAADLAARIGPLSESQAARAAAFLADASALVQAYTGPLGVVDDDEVIVVPSNGTVFLPGRPVTAVTTVAQLDGTTVPAADWVWNGLDEVDVDIGWVTPTMRVVYSHGTATPDGVIAVVCAMAARVLTAPSTSEGLSAETIGQYSYQSGGGSSSGVAVRLTKADMDTLAMLGLRRRSVSVTVRPQ